MNKIEIPLSKTKIVLLIVGSLLFVVAGFWIFFYAADQQTRYAPLLAKIAGAAAIVFFATTGIIGLTKLFDGKAGLVIDEKGITDNSSGVSAGLIEWRDITGIRTEQIMANKFLLIDTAQPNKYIERANRVKGRIMQSNLKLYGTPLAIASTALKFNFKELEALIRTEFEKHKR